MTSQMENIAFCLRHLRPDDKVLCFTQNQVFFDPLLKAMAEDCGKRFYEYDATCFEEKMVAGQCKVIINDYRTGLFNNEIQKRIRANYVSTGIGDILVPGFVIPPEESFRKRIWVKGDYYCPSGSLEINGKKMENQLINFEQMEYSFKNTSNRPVPFVYIFDKETLLSNKATEHDRMR